MAKNLATVERIFHAALALPEGERLAFVFRACGGDAELCRELESLILSHRNATAALEQAVTPVLADVFGTDAPEPELPAGTTLGWYAVEAKIGEGGMGAVYRARDTRLGRTVALKVLRRAVAATADARARVRREAKAAAALSHRSIAVLYEYGESDGSPWLAMEYARGVSLRSRLREGLLSVKAALDYATQVADALDHVHRRGRASRSQAGKHPARPRRGTETISTAASPA